MEWIKITNDNLPMQGSKVIITDGDDWAKAYVTNQFEFVDNLDDKLCFSGVTHFMYIELPKTIQTNKTK